MDYYRTIEKEVGETPLQALERLRERENISKSIPLAYAGRLDPMASGTLLVLMGDECKVQERYHKLDKEYIFEVLLGVTSDTGDVLGIIKPGSSVASHKSIGPILHELTGKIALPYPHFSSKTVQGKPLHTWTLEGRLAEIEVPIKKSTIYSLKHLTTYQLTAAELVDRVGKKINSLPTVTDPRKALGEDFRRHEVRGSWQLVYALDPYALYTVHQIQCIASSGTYMRSLAERIGAQLGTGALALSIHRTRIGRYFGIPGVGGVWTKRY